MNLLHGYQLVYNKHAHLLYQNSVISLWVEYKQNINYRYILQRNCVATSKSDFVLALYYRWNKHFITNTQIILLSKT